MLSYFILHVQQEALEGSIHITHDKIGDKARHLLTNSTVKKTVIRP